MRNKYTAQIMANTRRYIARNQQLVFDYLLTHPCVDCGESDPIVLEFDHVRGDKKRPLAKLIRQGLSARTIEDEIAKCDVRCANCHRRKTALALGWFRNGVAHAA